MKNLRSPNNVVRAAVAAAVLVIAVIAIFAFGLGGPIGQQHHGERVQATADLLKAVRKARRTRDGSDDRRTLALVEDALSRGADVNAYYGSSPDIVSATYRYIARQMPGGLAEDTTIEGRDRWPVVMYAASKGDADLVKLLVSHGANPKAHGEGGETMLDVAIESGSQDAVKLLLSLGANPNEKADMDRDSSESPDKGRLPLEDAAFSPAITGILLAHGADPNRTVHGERLVPYMRKRDRDFHTTFDKRVQQHGGHLTPERAAKLEAAIDRSLSLVEAATKPS